MFLLPDGTLVTSASDLTLASNCEFAFLRRLDQLRGRIERIDAKVDALLDRTAALGDLDLLHSVVEFKKKFYARAGARYDLAKPGTFRLLPPTHARESLAEDYDEMQIMLFGDAPAFDEILARLGQLEQAINRIEP